ncbi:MAG: prolipoprotein diacylglyceryl transferase [Ruminococcaceae bacterium]|nr:prolipoprotein diacylglyceryl transferase [Oscillospiraceae bacterium]
MYQNTTISFPFFGIEWDPIQVIQIGPLSLHIYGLIIGVGLMLAVLYGWRRSRQFGIKTDDITDGVLWIVPFAIVCARAYYCIFEWDERFADDPISVLYIWNGGLAIYGGIIGAVIGVAVFCYFKKIKLPALLDLVLLGFLIGQSIGRWGNFFNREAFGAETDIFIRMGLYQNADGAYSNVMHYFHPTFLYESLWNAAGFVLLHFLSKKRQYDGQIALGYVLWYGLGRTFIEGLRTDSLMWGDFRVSQILAGVTAIAAAVTLFVLSTRRHDPEKLFVNQVAALEQAEEEPETAEEETEEPEKD